MQKNKKDCMCKMHKNKDCFCMCKLTFFYWYIINFRLKRNIY